MPRRTALPQELDSRVRRFVCRLREIRDVSELSLARLAARTGYSRSSWNRYLTARSLPPRPAVEAFARACGRDPAPLLALYELAAGGEAVEHPPSEAAHLAGALRELKDRTGLSFAALAERTVYSKSSWARYLGGCTVPPQGAVRDLCAVADEPPERLTALHALAVRARSAGTADAADAAVTADPAGARSAGDRDHTARPAAGRGVRPAA